MAVRAKKNAFSNLGLYSLPTSIRQRPQVELKRFRFSILMVKFQGREVVAIAADLTFCTLALNQRFLSPSTATLLRNVGLTAIIGNLGAALIIKNGRVWVLLAIAQVTIYLLECRSLCGPVAQLVRAGDSSQKWCVRVERYEMNGMNSGKP